jgi:NAD(P)H-flavin reductase
MEDILAIGLAVIVVVISAVLWRVFGGKPALTRAYTRFPVIEKRIVSDNPERPVMFITFGVSTATLPTGQHVKVRMTIDGEVVERPYTPARFEPPECELLLRVYPHGKMSRYLYGLQVGDTVEMKGPVGHLRYGDDGPGSFMRGQRRKFEGVTHIAMIAGGTGITPMLQLVNHCLQDEHDATALRLVEANSCVDDIMMHDELRALATGSAGQLELLFTVSKLTAKERRAARNAHLVEQSLRNVAEYAKILRAAFADCPLGDDKTMICLCGPPGFVKAAKAIVVGIGYEQVLVW